MKDSIFDRFTPETWDSWFRIQAEWTLQIRNYICRKIKVRRFRSILELGSGTGVLLKYFSGKIPAAGVNGVELSGKLIEFCEKEFPELNMKQMDARDFLETNKNKFDLIFTHFFFLWDRDPQRSIELIKNCINPNGFFIIAAEPDYGGVMESPETGRNDLDIRSITKCGGDPFVGRKLFTWVKKTGYKIVESGLISKIKTNIIPDTEKFLQEFEFYRNFWEDIEAPEKCCIIKDNIINSIEKSEYFYFLPVMYFILRP